MRRTAFLALEIVAKGPSVFCLFGAGNLPDQELFPFVATKNAATGFLFGPASVVALTININMTTALNVLCNMLLLS